MFVLNVLAVIMAGAALAAGIVLLGGIVLIMAALIEG